MAAITDTRSFVRAVQDLFGVERLREHQQSMLRALLDGRHVFLSVRTGGGKSLCYMGFPAAAKALAKAETELGQAPRHLIALYFFAVPNGGYGTNFRVRPEFLSGYGLNFRVTTIAMSIILSLRGQVISQEVSRIWKPALATNVSVFVLLFGHGKSCSLPPCLETGPFKFLQHFCEILVLDARDCLQGMTVELVVILGNMPTASHKKGLALSRVKHHVPLLLPSSKPFQVMLNHCLVLCSQVMVLCAAVSSANRRDDEVKTDGRSLM
ncbi:hypothetical protein Bbelb_031840 [Branchiostoma belcheri]|nr:hypothetical protein Bbelb_031840 [Branchiostoma belcheri]